MRTAWLVIASLLVTTLSASASAETQETTEDSAPSPRALGRKQNFWRFEVGPRVSWVGSSGYDAFARKDILPEWSLQADKTLFIYDRFSFAAGVGMDVGGHAASARGEDATLFVSRFDVPLEARWHFYPWLFGFARVAPGAEYVRAEVDDVTKLTGGGWAFTTDLSAGASFLFGSHARPEKRLVRVWMSPEVGYALATSVPLTLTPADRDDKDTRPVGETDLGKLALGGPFARVSVALTF